MIMRIISLSRLRVGLPYMILGSIMTLVLLSPAWIIQYDEGTVLQGGPDSLLPGRQLQNLPNPCPDNGAPPSTQDKEKELMIKLMTNLLDKLDRNVDVPLTSHDVPLPKNQQGQLREWASQVPVNAETQGPVSYFKVAMSGTQKRAVYDALLTLEQVSKVHGFSWMLYSGTLLGSWRHHDIIPWDDDFDIFMNYTQREEIKSILSNMGPQYQFFEAGSRMKFWNVNGTIKSSSYPWQWPYLDISFFKENKTHIWDGSMEDDYGDRLYLYSKSIVFPLHPRPMGKYYFPAPRDSFAHILATYRAGGMGMCWTTHYSHRSESLTDKVHKIMCKELKALYPFVHRSASTDGKGIVESLRLNDREIQSVLVKEPLYAITDPYAVALL